MGDESDRERHDDRDDDGGGIGEAASGASDTFGGIADIINAVDDAAPDEEEGEETDEASPDGGDEDGERDGGDDEAGGSGEHEPNPVAQGFSAASHAAEGVAKTSEAAEHLKEAAEGFEHGDPGKGIAGLGDGLGNAGDALGSVTEGMAALIPDEGARRVVEDIGKVASGVGRVAKGLGHLVDGALDIIEDLTHSRQEVDFHLTIAGQDVEWHVRDVHYDDGLGRLTTAIVDARFSLDEVIDEAELLDKDVHLTMERGEEQRSIRGIIREAQIVRLNEEHQVRIDVVPALWLLSQGQDSRIYQDLSVPDLVEQVVRELLGRRLRTVRMTELTQSYQSHEYLVQHRESHYEFLARLCDEEGIFFYFDHDDADEQHEVLVLADSNDNRPTIEGPHDGQIEWEENESRTSGRDVAFGIHRSQRIGPTDVTVRGRDWSNPSLPVQQTQSGRGAWNTHSLEHYDHHHAVRHHDYDEGGRHYRAHTAERRARHHTERLDLARQSWTIQTTVVTAAPGRTFELVNSGDHDGRYLIVSVVGTGTTGEHGGELQNTLEVIPTTLPYRPPAPARRVMPGPETAIVVGDPGEEIHTDPHGRVKVQFYWDRQGQNDAHSSAWIRVAQGWAGQRWGMMFIPRVGMEVVVSFLGGDPDRPIISGCLYNGENQPPLDLPNEKTRSTIKTNSSTGGDGFNELRFEDKKGQEEIWLHAEKDLNEVVDHNHSTHVKNDQTLHVGHDRNKTIHHDEWVEIGHYHSEIVHGNEDLIIEGQRARTVKNDDLLTVQNGNRVVHVETGKDNETYDGGRIASVKPFDNLTVDGNRNTHVTGQYNIKSDGHYKIAQSSANELTIDDAVYVATVGRIQLKSGGHAVTYDADASGTLTISANTAIRMEVGNSSIEITSSRITIASTTVEVNGNATVDVKGGVVNLKP